MTCNIIQSTFTFAIAFSNTSNSDRPVDPSVAASLKIFSTCCSLIFRHISWLPVNTYGMNMWLIVAMLIYDVYVRTIRTNEINS